MRFDNAAIMTDVSMGADAVSAPINMAQYDMVSIQAVWDDGSPVGNFTIETSQDVGKVDPSTGLAVSGSIVNWDTYTGSTHAAGGGAGSFTWRLITLPDRWVRLKYTRSSASGTVSARFTAKGY